MVLCTVTGIAVTAILLTQGGCLLVYLNALTDAYFLSMSEFGKNVDFTNTFEHPYKLVTLINTEFCNTE